MEKTNTSSTKERRLETENNIINGNIADGEQVIAALYDAKLYPATEMYDQWVDLQRKPESQFS